MTDKKIPKPEDIQKEFEDFVHKRFGKQVQIIAQEFPNMQAEEEQSPPPKETEETLDMFNFNLKPKDIKKHLDRYVIGQDEAKKALAISVCDHYNQISAHQKNNLEQDFENYSKQNVLISGPTGVGKTYMVKQIAKLIGVPFVKADATRFSETGYMGANVDDLVKDLVNQSNGDISKAQYGIVYLDEADKLAASPSHSGRDVSGRGVQLGLLKLMEETEVDLKSNHDPASQIQAFLEIQQKGKIEKQVINTKYILFIASGAFTGLDDIIKKRIKSNSIGFSHAHQTQVELPDEKYLGMAETEDFIDYGFEPEFIGRLPVRVACTPLDENSLFQILKKSEGSLINQYTHSFRSYGIDLKFEDEALKELARMAAKEKTGARAFLTIFEKVFRDYKFEMPSIDIDCLVVTREVVLDPKLKLQQILETLTCEHSLEISQIREFEKEFKSIHHMHIKFDQAACKQICETTSSSSVNIKEYCWKLLQSYEYGLKLIKQNTGKSSFNLGDEVVTNPKLALERMVKESYVGQ